MKRITQAIALSSVAALLAGCGGGGTNGGAAPFNPTPANLATSTLQLAVGTAFNAADATTGLNVVATFRGTNGLSATLVNTPSITGPAGFTVPAGLLSAYGKANADAGTSTINGSPQVNVSQTVAQTTLGMFTGVFSYGLAPLNSDQSGVGGYFPGYPNQTSKFGFGSSAYNNTPIGDGVAFVPAGSFNSGLLPFWPQPLGAADSAQGLFLLGPPAVPFFNDGTFPGGFAGYSPGFTAIEAPPVAGAYKMNVTVASSNTPTQTFSASASIANVAPLPAPTLSGLTENGGGFTGTVTVGADPRIVETLVFFEDAAKSGTFYTVEVKGTGAQAFTLPATLGACAGSGCSTGSNAKPSFATGDTYLVTAISFDYPALEAGPPSNISPTPTLTGGAAQADLSIGVPTTGTY